MIFGTVPPRILHRDAACRLAQLCGVRNYAELVAASDCQPRYFCDVHSA